MIKYLCDRCSAMIEDSRTRYTFRIELFAAYDVLKLTGEDLAPDRDIRAGPDTRELRLNRRRRIGIVAPARDDGFRLFFSGFRLVERPDPGP